MIIHDIQNDPSFAPWRAQAIQRGYTAVAAFPLKTGGEIFGALMTYSNKHDAFNDEEVALLTQLAENIAFGMAKLRTEAARQQVVAELAQSKELFQTVTEYASDWAYWRDESQQAFLYMAPVCATITGYAAEAFIANPKLLDEMIHPEDRARWDTHMNNSETSVFHAPAEYRIVTRSGAVRWISHTCRPVILPDGTHQGLRGSNQDITERKQFEVSLIDERQKAEAANLAKSRFLATMSHEIRTPMNGILGMAQLLLTPNLTDKERLNFARALLNSGKTLLNLLNDMLDYAKTEAGKLTLESSVLDPGQLIAETQASFAEAARRKGLDMTAEWQGSPQCYLGDPHRLQQMLANLVGNAIKFTSEGRVRIEAREVERTEVELSKSVAILEFAVIDSGIGIAPDQQHLLFQPFSQVDSATTRPFAGTGLGLAIVRNLAHLMGGNVGVESESGGGSRFWFRLRAELVTTEAESGLDCRLPTVTLASAAPPVAENTLNIPQINALLGKIIPLLEQYQFEASPYFKELEDAVAGTEVAAEIAETGCLVAEFNFDSALARLRRIAAAQGWQGGSS